MWILAGIDASHRRIVGLFVMKKKKHKAQTKAARDAVLALWNMPPGVEAGTGNRLETVSIKTDRGVKPVEEEVFVKKAVRYVDF